MKKFLVFVVVFSLAHYTLSAQKPKDNKAVAEVAVIGFYNFENLFDTLDQTDHNDDEFLPNGSYNWTGEFYKQKLSNLDRVVSELGTDKTPDGVAILGIAEVEDREVLEDFVQQERVKNRHYQIVHYDSPDERGIDVALIYNPRYFRVTSSRPIRTDLVDADGKLDRTRDILMVSGIFKGEEPLTVMVNHWPSRRGGEAASRPMREYCAGVCKKMADSIIAATPNAKVIIMGDLNDDPVNTSVASVIGARGKKEEVQKNGFFNPFWKFYKEGLGSMAYQDAWSLFDQIIISESVLNPNQTGFRYYSAQVYKQKYMIQKTGTFKGYPFRTFDGNVFVNGYSDHFPTCIYLIKEVLKP